MMKAHDLLRIIVKIDLLLKKGTVPFSYLENGTLMNGVITKRLDEHLFMDERGIVHLFTSEDISIPNILDRDLEIIKTA